MNRRSTRNLTLTDAGRGYVDACRRIMDDIEEAVVPIVTEFLQAYPEVNVHLMLGDRIFNLIEDRLDLAVRVGRLPDSGMIATNLGEIRRVTCASPDYLAAHGRACARACRKPTRRSPRGVASRRLDSVTSMFHCIEGRIAR